MYDRIIICILTKHLELLGVFTWNPGPQSPEETGHGAKKTVFVHGGKLLDLFHGAK